MRKPILMLAMVFTMGIFFTSCRETNENKSDDTEMTDDMDDGHNVGDDIEGAAHDVGDAVENAAHETGDAVENAAHETGDAVDNAANDVEDEVSDDN